MVFDETTGTLFCGDLFSQVGDGPALVHDVDLLGRRWPPRTCSTPRASPPTPRRRCGASPSSSRGPWRSCTAPPSPATAGQALLELADAYEARVPRRLRAGGRPREHHPDRRRKAEPMTEDHRPSARRRAADRAARGHSARRGRGRPHGVRPPLAGRRRLDPAHRLHALGRAGHGRSRARHDRDLLRARARSPRTCGPAGKRDGRRPLHRRAHRRAGRPHRRAQHRRAHRPPRGGGAGGGSLARQPPADAPHPDQGRDRRREGELEDGDLVDIILTRDTWMHRADLAKATGKPMELTAEHDGRIVADAAAEWGRLHGQPCTLHLTGPVGGTFTQGGGGRGDHHRRRRLLPHRLRPGHRRGPAGQQKSPSDAPADVG